MKVVLILLFSILTSSLKVSADNLITGFVVELSDNSPISGANVLIKDAKGKILAYGTSDSNGHFTINLSSAIDELSIKAIAMGYKSYSAALPLDRKPIVIKMESSEKQLHEVIVKAARIWEKGDTLTYIVNSFAQKQDRTIGDVLKRMPGIDVAKNGKIQYQGIDINKFYIEGNDLLGGKYGVATNGISYDDIGAVEVLENHQPMQVLQGLSFSDQAAINLKMKNKAKATLLIHGGMSGGWSSQPKGMLWQSDIFTMMVLGKYQTITTFKGNNTGLNLSEQLLDYTAEARDETLNGYTSLSTPATANLQRKRSYFNRSWMVSSNHLIKTDKGNEIKLWLDYNNERLSAQGTGTTTYFLPSGNKVILEDKHSLAHCNALMGKFSYEVNKKTYFMNNTLSTDLSWNSLTLNTLGTLPNTQIARTPEYAVSNLLTIIKRFKNNRLVTFTSNNEWNSLPERLTINQSGHDYGQRIKQHSFYTDERASLGFVLNKAVLSLNGGVSGYFRQLNTDQFGIMNMVSLTGSEALTTDYLHVYAASKLEWSYKRLELTLNIPANLYTYFFSATLRNRTEFFLSPSLAARFRFTPGMMLTLQGDLHRSPASLHDIHSTSILTDYRSLSAGTDDYYTSSGQSLSAVYSYRNAQSGIFLMAIGSYGWNKSKFGTVQNILGNYVFYSYRPQPSDTHNAMALFNISKTLDFMRGAFGLKGIYRMMENMLLSQGVQTDYRNDVFSLSPFVNGNISKYLNWSLHFTWDKSIMKISNVSHHCTYNFIYSGTVTFTPCPLITWSTDGEFYHNQIQKGYYKDILMLDTKLTFNISKRVELSIVLTNLLNKKEYSYTSYGTVSQYERSNQLRGRELMVSLYLKK